MNAVEAIDLTKKYKDKIAVDGISFSVEQGELFALLGVNGAGKTTTIRMLCCLSQPTSGEAKICGKSTAQSAEVKRVIGISTQDTAVAEKLSVYENLMLMGRIYGFSKQECAEKAEELLSTFGMEEIKNQRAGTLSGGWKRRLSIAMALISQPQVLFLDEPTLGLDVLARRELWNAISALKGKTTIILTTHYMEEAESLSDRIAIMLDGKIRAIGTLAQLEAQTGEKGLEACFIKIAEGVKA